MLKKKLRLRGWDLSGEIRAKILQIFPLGLCKTVGWRPIWCQKGVFLGPLGFQARLAHPNQPKPTNPNQTNQTKPNQTKPNQTSPTGTALEAAGRQPTQPNLYVLSWLACLLCLALAWSGVGLSCLPCLGLVQQQQPAAFGGRRRLRRRCCCCWTRPRQGRQDRPRPDQAKARHNKQASQAKAGWLAGRNFRFFFLSPKCPKKVSPGPGAPWGGAPPVQGRLTDYFLLDVMQASDM